MLREEIHGRKMQREKVLKEQMEMETEGGRQREREREREKGGWVNIGTECGNSWGENLW